MMNHPQTTTSPHDNTPSSMLAVMVLALSAFVFNTTEFIPIALLTDIGASFGMNASQTGVMMTVYAWVVAVMSLPMMLITAKMERKKLLLSLFLVFVLAHGLSFWANSFGHLLVCRVLIALTHAIFWSITSSLVLRLAPKDKQTYALGLLATGSALATVLGLPLGRLLGQMLGWRTSFGVIGLIGLVIMGCLFVLLPKVPAKNVGSLSSLPKVIKNTSLLTIYAMVVLMVSAHFTVYSYIEPFVLKVSRFGADFATMVLLIVGAAGLVGSWLFGRFYDRLGDVFVAISFGTLLVAMALLYPLVDYQWLWTVAVFCWGVAMTCLALSLQMRVLKLAHDYTDVAMSLFSGIFNVGIGAGAMMGGLVIASSLGLSMIGYVGAAIMLLAVAVFAWSVQQKRKA